MLSHPLSLSVDQASDDRAPVRHALKDVLPGVTRVRAQTVGSVPARINVERKDDAVAFTRLIKKYYTDAADKVEHARNLQIQFVF